MLEKKILRWSSIIIFTLMCATIGFLYSYPTLQKSYSVVEDLEEEATTENPRFKGAKNPDKVVENREELKGKLKLDIPDDVSNATITVENDYMTQTVYVRFPTECKDYFSYYKLQGSSDCIASIAYTNEDGKGIMALQLDRLYEVENTFEKNAVYLKFIDPHDVYDKVIVIDAGHGIGAKGGATMAGVDEASVNLAIVTQLKHLLDTNDKKIGVYYTRLDEMDVSLQDRAKLANAARADLMISVHNNAYVSDRWSYINGTSVLYSQSDTREKNSRRLAEICLEHLNNTLGSNRRGLVEGDTKYIIRTVECPIALVEVGYLTNREEFAKLTDPEYQKMAAQALYDSILQAFEEGF